MNRGPLDASWMRHPDSFETDEDEWCEACGRLVPRGGDPCCLACGDEVPGRDEPWPG